MAQGGFQTARLARRKRSDLRAESAYEDRRPPGAAAGQQEHRGVLQTTRNRFCQQAGLGGKVQSRKGTTRWETLSRRAAVSHSRTADPRKRMLIKRSRTSEIRLAGSDEAGAAM